MDPEEVGVHPDNRERSMLVGIDVQDLLLRIASDGWSWARWDALACERPPNHIGAEWADANKMLAQKSNGLLASYRPDLLKVFTARGSHGTAAVRAVKLGAKSAHDSIASDGMISRSKIVEH